MKSISKELFIHNPHLKVINLYGNQIFMIQRGSFERLLKLEGLYLLGNECVKTNFGCPLISCPRVGRINDHLESCFLRYVEQESKLKEGKFSNEYLWHFLN
jgi:hypothetical protein